MDATPRRLGLILSALFFLMFFPPGAAFTAGFTFMARPLALGRLGLTPGQVSAVAVAGALGNLAAIALVRHLHAFTCRRALAILLTCGAILIGLLAAFSGAYAADAASRATTLGISAGAPVGVVALIGIFSAASRRRTVPPVPQRPRSFRTAFREPGYRFAACDRQVRWVGFVAAHRL
ncbi:MAG: hypothetical protein ACLP9L_07645 [Thermoguttaceae bacterium]